ncbi:hypothetical protein MLD38_033157 [Melastoma candidum]|uniref:Uncharacterized protein n=1 Tax=Melastoma candidum TaxID=119954 RepID=A0ACB9M5W3_9MYRT|nr:hypothetical protein MLD38_033157 [Melastoma candidum]
MDNFRKLIRGKSSSQDSPSNPQTGEAQLMDVSAKKFTWKIPNFSKLTDTKCYSQSFLICGGKWRILMYPKGNSTDHLSLYLDVPDASAMPSGWKQNANFSFVLVNQKNANNSKILGTQNEFNARSVNWGFPKVAPLSEIHDRSKGYLVNDTLIVEVKFESQPTGEHTVTARKFRWKITNYSSLTAKIYFSPAFELGGGNWQLVIYPNGSGTEKTHLSLYLEVANSASLPEGWTRKAKFKLLVVNQNSNSRSILREAENEFKFGRISWGFTSMILLNDLRDSAKGFVVNNTLIVEAQFVLPEVPAEGEQLLGDRKLTWKITNFSRLNAVKYYSRIFAMGGSNWKLLIYPEGDNSNGFSTYLEVANHASLPQGWTKSAKFSFILVNQTNANNSKIKETQTEFNTTKISWGFPTVVSLTELHDRSKGFLVNDTVIVEVEFVLPEREIQPGLVPVPMLELEPPISLDQNPMDSRPTTDMFDSYFSNLEQFITQAEVLTGTAGSSLYNENALMLFETPSLEDVGKAKQLLKECLSDLFKLNMKERLAEALTTLSVAQAGLTVDQQKSIKDFRANFDEFTSDFLSFEQDNADFELQKVLKDQMFSTMKRSHETHLSLKALKDELAREEEELELRLQEVRARREKLISDWEILLAESEDAKTKYKIQEKKVAEAEEKKRIAEERMSRSTTAWSNLKAHFT